MALICWPLRGLTPIWPLAAISAAAGMFLVWLFGKTSQQDRIRSVRGRVRGNLSGVKLFPHDIGVVLRLQRVIFVDTLRFMRLALAPMLIMTMPVLLIMTQLDLRFAARPLRQANRPSSKLYGGMPPHWINRLCSTCRPA
ncbi:MAG: hypothetical protein VYE68_16975 [Acidobacteriota bacterium]|nr:hypothetical protein [Acidobacteriota bacterium]